MNVENTSGLCLFLSDRPTPREIARACTILRGNADRTVCVLAAHHARRRISAQLATDTNARWYERAAIAQMRSDFVAMGIKAAVCLSEAPHADEIPDFGTHYGTWAILDCDSQCNSGADALRQLLPQRSEKSPRPILLHVG